MSENNVGSRFNNDDRNERVVALHQGGMTNAAIVRRMGLSHNIVAGILSRWRELNGIPAPVSARKAAAPKKPKAEPNPKPAKEQNTGRADAMRLAWERRRARAVAMPGTTMAGYEAQVMADRCRYISGDMREGNARFCGEERVRRRSYCAHHELACTRRGGPVDGGGHE